MSYSFSARAATRSELVEKVSMELDNVVAQQPIHSADRAQALAAAEAFLNVLPEAGDAKDFYISVSGSVSWNGGEGEEKIVVAASVNVSASLVAKESA